MVEAPQTEEGWYVLHDFRVVDWDAWRSAPNRERERALEAGEQFLRRCESASDVEPAADAGEVDAEAGTSAVFSVLGHEADLLLLHFRPTLDDLSALERRLETTAFGAFTERADSYVSVTEVSDYVSDAYFEDDGDVDPGIERYIEGKLEPEIPDDVYVSFYPMDRRRGEEYNWYDLEYDDRADMLSSHGTIGKRYAGEIKQVIASSLGFDDHEWGVTLFGDDPTRIKDIVYEMRFDEASSKYGEFGRFYVGRRFPPADLGTYLAGETVPTGAREERAERGHPHGEDVAGDHPHGSGRGGEGDHPHGENAHPHGEGSHAHDTNGRAHGGEKAESDEPESIRGELEDLDVYAGQPHGEDVYATVLYSEADVDDLFEEVEGLRGNFDHYGTHVKTAVYRADDRDRSAVVSIWDTASAAETAAGFLSELPGIVERAGEESGFGTMGMFYTVEPEHREDFVEKFETVGEVLADLEGHHDTDLMANVEDENDMFIASQWRSKEDAMDFFRSDDFRETVQWGRDVLADRPRHVFLA